MKWIASYDAVWINIDKLNKINFFYWSNWSWKTTMTNFITNQQREWFEQCILNWDWWIEIETLVYNKEFRKSNFWKWSIDWIFTIWKATKDDLDKIKILSSELNIILEKWKEKSKTIEKQKNDKNLLENSFKEEVWLEIYKKYEINFKQAFVWYLNKESFKNKLLQENNSNVTVLLSIEELKRKSKTIFDKEPQILPILSTFEFSRITEIENDLIWTKKIIWKNDVEIATLIQKLNIIDWVNEWTKYIQDWIDICPFCQQSTIDINFRKKLEEYFDETFLADTSKIKTLEQEYNSLLLSIENLLIWIEIKEKQNLETKLNLDNFSALLKTFSSQFITNKELLVAKNKEPSRIIKLLWITIQLQNIFDFLANVNVDIIEHNKIVENYKAEKETLISSVWKYIINENSEKLINYQKKINWLEKWIRVLEWDRKKLLEEHSNKNNKIKELNKKITSIQPAIDEINRTLKSFWFLNFQIIPSEIDKNQYQIIREDWTLAEMTLSEWEITFITFLYFFQLIKWSKNEKDVTTNRILVIDDPISSLDSNILFVVSTLIKWIINDLKNNIWNIKQLFLLTHNVYFHKEASFINWRTKEINDTFFWIIRKNNNISSIQFFEKQNPINNSYELLWKELKNKTINSSLTLQNTMRRIIENYFKILWKYWDDELINKFDNFEDQQICRSLICWINDGSHCIPDDLYIEHQEWIIEKYFDVFKRIFDNMGHGEHYNMMMN